LAFGYRKNVEKDLPTWVEQGWVSRANGEKILASIDARSTRFSFANVLAVLGAVLLCFGFMTFVAANWSEISKLGRLIILFSGLWLAYGAALYCKSTDKPGFADAALLLGVGIFGASIMLISQTYHIDGHAPDAVFMWGLGALATGVLGRSRPVLGLAVILFTVWSCWEMLEQFRVNREIHWLFAPFWLICVMAFIREKWRIGYHLAMLCFLVWFFSSLVNFVLIDKTPEVYIPLFGLETGLLIAGIGLVAGMAPARMDHFDRPLVAYGYAVLLFSAFYLQMVFIAGQQVFSWPVFVLAGFGAAAFAVAWRGKRINTISLAIGLALACVPLVMFGIGHSGERGSSTVVYEILAGTGLIILAIWAIQFRWQRDNRLVTVLGYVTFGVELLYIYFRTFGTLLDTALFYLIAGVLLVAMGFVFARLERRSLEHQEVEQ